MTEIDEPDNPGQFLVNMLNLWASSGNDPRELLAAMAQALADFQADGLEVMQ